VQIALGNNSNSWKAKSHVENRATGGRGVHHASLWWIPRKWWPRRADHGGSWCPPPSISPSPLLFRPSKTAVLAIVCSCFVYLGLLCWLCWSAMPQDNRLFTCLGLTKSNPVNTLKISKTTHNRRNRGINRIANHFNPLKWLPNTQIIYANVSFINDLGKQIYFNIIFFIAYQKPFNSTYSLNSTYSHLYLYLTH